MSLEFLWRLFLNWCLEQRTSWIKSWCLYSVTLILVGQNKMWAKTSREATPSQSIGQRNAVVLMSRKLRSLLSNSLFQLPSFKPTKGIIKEYTDWWNNFLKTYETDYTKTLWTTSRQFLSTFLKYKNKGTCLQHWNRQSWITRFHGCSNQTMCH